MRVYTSCGDDESFSSDDLGTGTNQYGYAWLNIGVSSLADRLDSSILDAYVRLDDPVVINDGCIGDNNIDGPF